MSIYATWLICRHHATWMKNDDPTFTNFSELRFLQKSWDKMQEQGRQTTASAAAAYEEYSGRPQTTRGVASGTVPSEADAAPVAVAKAAARPKRTARATAAPAAVVATAAAAAAAAADNTETLTATVTVIRPRPKRATRAVAPPMDAQTATAVDLPVGRDYLEDDDWWDEATPTSSRVPSIVERAAATRRSPWTARTEEGQ